jgi:hypothetical protein
LFDANNVNPQVLQFFLDILHMGIGWKVADYCLYGFLGFGEKGIA